MIRIQGFPLQNIENSVVWQFRGRIRVPQNQDIFASLFSRNRHYTSDLKENCTFLQVATIFETIFGGN